MHFGTYMGIYWILKFILFPLGFHIPFLSLLFVILTLAVPFIGYHYVKMYRDKICGGSIQFSHAVLFTIFMYMFASLLVAVAHYRVHQKTVSSSLTTALSSTPISSYGTN